jgi:hypothetical protein
MNDTWQAAWDPLIAAVGTDVLSDKVERGADVIEAGQIRAFIEALEFDCPLHYDPEVARDHGYPDVIAPYSSVLMFALGPLRAPGSPSIFTSHEPDWQPDVPAMRAIETGLEPPTASGYFATDLAIDFVRPPVVGERLSHANYRLLSCVPKETRVGRGAFTTWEWDFATEAGEVVATYRETCFVYEPHPSEEGSA